MKMKKTSEVFRAAKKYLNRGNEDKTDYICGAISDVEYAKLATARVADRARHVINSRLGEEVSVTHWLKVRGFVPMNKSPYNNLQVQKYRHRWLNALIREFEAKGD
jgi:hypothetical protein